MSNGKTIKVPVELVEQIIDLHGRCDHWDHQGYCQTHNLQPRDECWMMRLSQLLENQ